jgi:hypothetical protein
MKTPLPEDTKIVLHHHLGLGDHFVCNGLVNFLSIKYEQIFLPCKKHNYETVNYLYSENNKITVFTIEDNEISFVNNFAEERAIPVLRIGFEHTDYNNWAKSFYDQIGLPFEYRYELFAMPIRKDPDNIIQFPEEKFIIIHNESSQQKYDLTIATNPFSYKEIYIRKETEYPNLFSYVPMIFRAKQIHCINSSIFHLIDSLLLPPNIELYYHDIRQDGTSLDISSKWMKINYA